MNAREYRPTVAQLERISKIETYGGVVRIFDDNAHGDLYVEIVERGKGARPMVLETSGRLFEIPEEMPDAGTIAH